MPHRTKVIAIGVDDASYHSLRQAFSDGQVNSVSLKSPGPLAGPWDPRVADLIVLSARDQDETAALCRGLRNQLGRATTLLLVLVPPACEGLVQAALEAGATSCLVLPVHPKELVNLVAQAHAGNRPGRHTLGLDPAQQEDRWRDDGGEG